MTLNTRTPLEDVTHDLETRIPALMKRAHVPGLSLALVRDGAIAWTRAFGLMRAGEG
jgi:hypothetical protein